MTTATLRERLHQQIDKLPDDVVQQIADFTSFVAARRRMSKEYIDWTDDQWQDFALKQFFREADEDEIEYALADAQEIYHP